MQEIQRGFREQTEDEEFHECAGCTSQQTKKKERKRIEYVWIIVRSNAHGTNGFLVHI